MVGTIEPLDFEEKTNIKQHQAIISKVNEVIDAIDDTTVGNGKITLKQGSQVKGEFTVNQDEDATIVLDAGGAVVNDATITIKQGSAIRGSFTTNQGVDATITLESGGGGSGFVWGEGTGTITEQTDLVEYVADEIAEETAARTAAITSLEGTIASEATMRATGDDTLEAAINALDGDVLKKTAIKTAIASTLTDTDVVSGKAIYDQVAKTYSNEVTVMSPLPSGVTSCTITSKRVGRMIYCEVSITTSAAVSNVEIARIPECLIGGGAGFFITNTSTSGTIQGIVYPLYGYLYFVGYRAISGNSTNLSFMVEEER